MQVDRNILVVNAELRIPLWEFQFSFARSSGPGGQNVNKVNSKAVMRWTPAWNQSLPEPVRRRFLNRYAGKLSKEGELILTSDEFRDQKRNQDNCLEKLKSMVLAVARAPKVRRPTKPTRSSQEKRKDSKTRRGDIKKNRGKVSW